MTEPLTTGGQAGYLRIATEEAYAPPELIEAFVTALETTEDIGFSSLMGHYLTSDAERPRFVRDRLQDAGEKRLSEMDAAGIDHAVLALTSPGTQVLGDDEAREIAAITNDRIAEASRTYPSRFSGLAAVGFGDVPAAVKELERAVSSLGLKGLICNSHIRGHYLDEPRFFPILEAAESLGVPVYLHPNTPNNDMIKPLYEAGLDGAIFGFGVETAMHLLRMITAGVFDRFPRLKLVVGHLGEALPYWLYRLDYMHAGQVKAKRYEAIKPLELKISEYFRRNIWLTTSGMPWAPTIMYAREVVGADRVMYAMDYPYEYVPDEVRMQDALPLTPAELKQFYQDNAIEVFGLDEAALTGS
ncbi:amidohydrolase family protein [Amycolatopsis alkalitolerans]|uniref:Amidohydrolase n=1 Tax=Amycolatopsis alkalitolerans TaxID=2547244 RepID=A0A5C4M7A4_9PSEU|nr:amidohydrolase family protein [Amycolatopsis alkalitolerans]TNC26923.1 amidohydrolase [Amycolatopsis alkalitolerans]